MARSRRLRWFAAQLAVTAIYFAAGKAGLRLASIHPSASAVWPPTGIAIAAILLIGTRVWPSIFVGAFLVNVTTMGTLGTSLGIATGNTLEALLASLLARRFARAPGAFERPGDALRYALFVVVAGALGATVGVASLLAGGFATVSKSAPIWLTWWLGDTSGGLVVAPLLLTWAKPGRLSWGRPRLLEAGLVYGSILLSAAILFSRASPLGRGNYPLTFLAIPPLVWAAFRFSEREASAGLVALSAIAIWGTFQGLGPFGAYPREESLLMLQLFMGILSVMILAVAAAVTQSKKLESSAEEANHLKDEFLATVSHELRTPLNAIVGWAHLLRDGRLDPDASRRAIEAVSRNADVQSRLISDVLDISRMALSGFDLARRPVELNETVASAVETMRPAAQARRIGLSTTLLRDHATLHGDPERLQQVVWNLLSNSIKFTPEGGHVDVALQMDGATASIVIEDDGPGIAPEFLPFVFDRFRRKDVSATGQGGLGLGLAIVRRIVELHGGSVSARNRQGNGAVFTVSLPLVPPTPSREGEPAKTSPGAEHGAALEGVTILLVEDFEDSRELIATILTQHGARVQAVESAPAALAALKRGPAPDLLISDIQMPQENGYDLIAKIRALDPAAGGAIPAIALTAYAAPEDAARAIGAGYQAHIAKPVRAADLVSAAAHWTKRESVF